MSDQDTKIKKLIPADLNAGQKEAYIKMRDFINAPHGSGMFLLEGFAGTGKTYSVSKILKYVEDNKSTWRNAVTAPTNKAVKVLKRMGGLGTNKRKVVFQTIHKLLGLTEEITSDGRQTFVRKYGDECNIEEYDLVIVDEVSMLNDELFDELQSHSGYVKIIFMGDPAQIPPVGKSDCIPFKKEEREKYGIDMYLLTEIMRQTEGNPILEAGFAIRNDLENPSTSIRETKQNELGQGVISLSLANASDRDNVTKLFEEYFASKEFESNPDHAKVIAWRNVTIDKLNSIIRLIIYRGQTLTRIMVGEKLVANKPIVDKYNVIVFNTNDEFEVVSYTVEQRTCATEAESVKLKFYHTKVEYTEINGDRSSRVIDILHEESYRDFERVLQDLKKDAISKKGYDAKKAWVKYYEFMRQFADVIYNYAITAHKAQGSTYTNTFIMDDDIDRNQNVYERNRIRYTSYSRPTNKLFLIRQ